MGIVEAGTGGPDSGDFGFEGAGIVSSIGPNVEHLVVGDRVAFSSVGCFAASLSMREDDCTKIPDSLSFEDAATMPCVYGTAMYGLMDLARLEKGQVLSSQITQRCAARDPDLIS